MKAIHTQVKETAEQYGDSYNYPMGANIAGLTKVADAVIDQGVV